MSDFWSIALGVGGLGAIGCFVFWSLMKKILPSITGHPLNQKQTFFLAIFTISILLLALIAILITYYMTHPGQVGTAVKNADQKPDVSVPSKKPDDKAEKPTDRSNKNSDLEKSGYVSIKIDQTPENFSKSKSKIESETKPSGKIRSIRIIIEIGREDKENDSQVEVAVTNSRTDQRVGGGIYGQGKEWKDHSQQIIEMRLSDDFNPKDLVVKITSKIRDGDRNIPSPWEARFTALTPEGSQLARTEMVRFQGNGITHEFYLR